MHKHVTLNRKAQSVLERTGMLLLLSAGAVSMAVPFLWMVSTSLKYPVDIFSLPPQWIPERVTLDHYVRAWWIVHFDRFMLNSFIIALGVVIGRLVVCSMAAYAFARLRFPFRDTLFLAYIGTMMLPWEVTLIPSYLVIKWFNWLDTYQALIVPFLANPFGTFLLRQFFITIPQELEDAARIDGCNTFQTIWHIFLPLARGPLAIVGVISFMFGWNEFLWPLVVTSRESMYTVQIGLASLKSETLVGATMWGELMAATTIVTLPIIVVFILAQRQLMEGIGRGALKG